MCSRKCLSQRQQTCWSESSRPGPRRSLGRRWRRLCQDLQHPNVVHNAQSVRIAAGPPDPRPELAHLATSDAPQRSVARFVKLKQYPMAGVSIKTFCGTLDRKHRLQRLIATSSRLGEACPHRTNVAPPSCLELSTAKASKLFEVPASPKQECCAVRL